MARSKPIVFIVGPTGSGKTNLAIKLAKQFKGEIICADSRTIYKGLDIGTAKPTKSQQLEVVHWGLDLIEPNQKYSVAEFQEFAKEKIIQIQERNKVPFVVGGSGLYVDSLLFDYKFNNPPDHMLRKTLQDMSVEELIKYCENNNIELPENYKNKRYLIRAIEQKGINQSRNEKPLNNSVVVGITMNKNQLEEKIRNRSVAMIANGLIKETYDCANKYGWNADPLASGIYKIVHQHYASENDANKIIDLQVRYEMQLVKKQLTWFKRNKYINWLDLESAYKYLSDYLAKYN